jgi:hypothetical protein
VRFDRVHIHHLLSVETVKYDFFNLYICTVFPGSDRTQTVSVAGLATGTRGKCRILVLLTN